MADIFDEATKERDVFDTAASTPKRDEGKIRKLPSAASRELDRWKLAARHVGALGQGIARNVISPVYGLAERIAAPLEGRPVGTIDSPITRALGGPIPVKPGLKATLGDVAQTAALAAPFTGAGKAAFAARPIATSAVLGGAIGAGQAASEDKGIGPIIGRGLVGAGTSAAIPAIGKALTPATSEEIIASKFTKAIRPTVVGKSTIGQLETYNARAADAVKTIVRNKPNLKIVDEFGEPTGKLPESLHQFAQSIEQTKKQIFKQYNEMQKLAGAAGAKVDLVPVTTELAKVVNDPIVKDINPNVGKYAASLLQRFKARGEYSTEEAERAIATFNQKLEPFFKNPSYENAAKASVDAKVAKLLRSGLDSSIEEISGEQYQPLKNTYGALSAIEKDVVHRAIVDARRNPKSLASFTDIFAASDMVTGVLKLDPSRVAAGSIKKIVSEFIKWRNDPNPAIKQMFRGVEKAEGVTP